MECHIYFPVQRENFRRVPVSCVWCRPYGACSLLCKFSTDMPRRRRWFALFFQIPDYLLGFSFPVEVSLFVESSLFAGSSSSVSSSSISFSASFNSSTVSISSSAISSTESIISSSLSTSSTISFSTSFSSSSASISISRSHLKDHLFQHYPQNHLFLQLFRLMPLPAILHSQSQPADANFLFLLSASVSETSSETSDT